MIAWFGAVAVAAVLVALLAVAGRNWASLTKSARGRSAEARLAILRAPASRFGVTPREGEAWAAIMETADGTVLSVFADADGRTRLWCSDGVGVIENFDRKSVRESSSRFVRAARQCFAASAQSDVAALARAEAIPPISFGRTRFYVRIGDDVLAAEAPDEALAAGGDRLSPLFDAGHDVLRSLRSAIAEEGAGRGPRR